MRKFHYWVRERIFLYSPIGLRLVDDFTGEAPVGRVTAMLDLSDGAGGWRPTEIRAVQTLSGFLAYPGLERRADAAGTPRRYRIRLAAEFYRPAYPAPAEGFEFDAFPYNDGAPPAVAGELRGAPLLPTVNYPFPVHVPVLRGRVVDAAGEGVEGAEVACAHEERALCDGQGEFALPLRWVAPHTPVEIDAIDAATGRLGTIFVTLPASLSKSQTIAIA